MQTSLASRLPLADTKPRPRVLIIDDDESLVTLLGEILEAQGLDSLAAIDGESSLEIVRGDHVDLVILDLTIPVMDGFQVLERIRQFSSVPVIILSARQQEESKIACLSLGADDYVTKPFGSRELVARCWAVLRRADSQTPRTCLCIGDVELNFQKRLVRVAGREVRLTRHEYELLKELMLNAGVVLSYEHLLQRVWGIRNESSREYIHIYTSRLRSKIECNSAPSHYIVAVSGVGYVFQCP